MRKLRHSFVDPIDDLPGFPGTKPSDWNAPISIADEAGTAPAGVDAEVSIAPISYYQDYGITIIAAITALPDGGTLRIPAGEYPDLTGVNLADVILIYDGPQAETQIGQGLGGTPPLYARRLVRGQSVGSHTDSMRILHALEYEVVDGANINGPTTADVGQLITVFRTDWFQDRTTIHPGEGDNLALNIRWSGPQSNGSTTGSDASLLLGNILTVGDHGFTALLEGVNIRTNDDFTINQYLDVQVGTIDWTALGGPESHALNLIAIGGSLTGAILIQEAGGTWGYALRIGADAARIEMDGSVTLGNPTGGNKGAGTINAKDVYDDGVLLVCAPLLTSYLETGQFTADDLAIWDAMVPDHVVPEHKRTVRAAESKRTGRDFELVYREVGPKIFEEVYKDQTGQKMTRKRGYLEGVSAIAMPVTEEITVAEQRTPRQHDMAHLFFKMVNDEGFDPRDPVNYVQRMRRQQGLPGMPSRTEWKHGALSLADMHNRTNLALDCLAVAFDSHVKHTEKRLAALEALRLI